MNDIINILNQVRIVSQKIKEQRKEKFERGENYNIFNYLISAHSVYTVDFFLILEI